jgi:cell division cycle 2-like
MSGKRSRWDEDEDEDEEAVAKKKMDKEAKKRAKLAPQQDNHQSPKTQPPSTTTQQNSQHEPSPAASTAHPSQLPSRTTTPQTRIQPPTRIFPLDPPEITPCRSVEIYEQLNHIEEGSYGVVYRARDTETNAIVALKQLKLDKEKNGFPVTGLREISTLMSARHPNIVNIREIVVGESLKQYPPLPPFLSFFLLSFGCRLTGLGCTL